MITEYNRLSGLDKVAIVFSVLGEGLAVKLIKGLGETEVRKIRSRIREMEPVSSLIKKQVVDEFYLAFISRKLQKSDVTDAKRPFEFLDSLADEQLAALLEVEEPRIIAMAAAQVSSERRMVVINRLAPEVKGRVLMEMGNLSEVPLEAIVNVATQLEHKSHFLPRAVDFSRGGGKSIADILGQMPPEEEERYLETISRESPDLVKEIKKYYLTFDDIFSFPDNLLREIMNTVELDTIALAFKGLPQETSDKVLNNLPQKKQAMYEPVEGAIPKREVNMARKTIVDAARQMEKEGRFNLEDVLGGSEMVD
ncbi:MAG: FliG C-terminal domain-containing protein [Candidatus Neomarinimicrobiota bacterium]